MIVAEVGDEEQGEDGEEGEEQEAFESIEEVNLGGGDDMEGDVTEGGESIEEVNLGGGGDMEGGDMEGDMSEEEENNDIGRQVAVLFSGKADPGIISHYDKKTGLYTVDFDDESVYRDITHKELIFLD